MPFLNFIALFFSLMLLACTNGIPKFTQLASSASLKFTTQKKSFQLWMDNQPLILEGQCDPKVEDLYIRFSSDSSWVNASQVANSSLVLDCENKGIYKLELLPPRELISLENLKPYTDFSFELYGANKTFKSLAQKVEIQFPKAKNIGEFNDRDEGSMFNYGNVSSFMEVNTGVIFLAKNKMGHIGLWKRIDSSGEVIEEVSSLFSEPVDYYDVKGLFLLNQNVIGYLNINSSSYSGCVIFILENSLPIPIVLKSDCNADPTEFNGKIYFTGYSDASGYELWRTDGTFAGTVLHKDIYPGSNSSNPKNFYLSSVGLIYFSADNGTQGVELWKTDGTPLGTTLVKDIQSGISSSSPEKFFDLGSYTLFVADNGINGSELWRTDSTEGGTVLIKDIYVGFSSSFPNMLPGDFSGYKLFVANNGINGSELWKTDGTEAGTILLKDIYVGSGSSSISTYISMFHSGVLYFTARTSTEGLELWKTDGTAVGTVLIKDIFPGPGSSAAWGLFPSAGGILFRANDGVNGSELWISDGSAAGTLMVKDINPGLDSSYPMNFIEFQGKVYFTASHADYGYEIWVSDGTEAGTKIKSDIYSGKNTSEARELKILNNQLWFSANDGIHGPEPWLLEYEGASPKILKNINVQPKGIGSNVYMAATQKGLFFTADTYSYGNELWFFDTTSKSTTLIKDMESGNLSSYPNNLFVFNDDLAFSVWDSNYVQELVWIVDGDSLNLRAMKSQGGQQLAKFYEAFSTADKVYFNGAEQGSNDNELWTTDFTEGNTQMVKNISSFDSSYPNQFISLDTNKVLFRANEGLNGVELWLTDGTEAGTNLVKDINPGTNGSYPYHLFKFNNKVYFNASDFSSDYELWESDGTFSGTQLVADIYSGTTSSYPYDFFEFSNQLFFLANDGLSGSEFWKLESGGPQLFIDLTVGSDSTYIQYPTIVQDKFYFFARGPDNKLKIYQSDGTALGTKLFMDFPSGTVEPIWMKAHKGLLLFAVSDYADDNNSTIYVSDGSADVIYPFIHFSKYLMGYEPEIFEDDIMYFTGSSYEEGNQIYYLGF